MSCSGIHSPVSSMTPDSSIAAAQGQCSSTQPGISESRMPWRRQMRSAISRASGSMLELMRLELMILEFMAHDRIRLFERQFGDDGDPTSIGPEQPDLRRFFPHWYADSTSRLDVVPHPRLGVFPHALLDVTQFMLARLSISTPVRPLLMAVGLPLLRQS